MSGEDIDDEITPELQAIIDEAMAQIIEVKMNENLSNGVVDDKLAVH
jgi:hypothetical protein